MKFLRLCKRTNDPKLTWLEGQLTAAGIPHRRDGNSFHAPILEVAEEHYERANALLKPIDDIDDDDPVWERDGIQLLCPACGAIPTLDNGAKKHIELSFLCSHCGESYDLWRM